jgi:hypothetical protein
VEGGWLKERQECPAFDRIAAVSFAGRLQPLKLEKTTGLLHQ